MKCFSLMIFFGFLCTAPTSLANELIQMLECFQDLIMSTLKFAEIATELASVCLKPPSKYDNFEKTRDGSATTLIELKAALKKALPCIAHLVIKEPHMVQLWNIAKGSVEDALDIVDPIIADIKQSSNINIMCTGINNNLVIASDHIVKATMVLIASAPPYITSFFKGVFSLINIGFNLFSPTPESKFEELKKELQDSFRQLEIGMRGIQKDASVLSLLGLPISSLPFDLFDVVLSVQSFKKQVTDAKTVADLKKLVDDVINNVYEQGNAILKMVLPML